MGQNNIASRLDISAAIRLGVELSALTGLALWGATQFTPWWNILTAIGAPALFLLMNGLFIHPKALIRIDPLIRALLEIVILFSATLAWWAFGAPTVALIFALIATLSGAINGWKDPR